MTTIQRPASAGSECSICGGRLTANEEVCPACGALVLPAQLEAAAPAFCPECGTATDAEARFCESCGASLSKAPREARKAPGAPLRFFSRRLVVAAVGVAAAALAVAGLFVLLGGGGGEETVGPTISMPAAVTPDARVVAGLQAVADKIPKPAGATDRDQVRSLLGAPDAFEVAFDLADGGRSETLIRYETWYYFEIESAFEFADGNLIGNMPADDVSPLAILPRQYDPSMFRAEMTVAEVKKLVAAPDAMMRIDAPAELGVTATAYYGEQLMVAFDESGLILVETYPLQGGGSDQ